MRLGDLQERHGDFYTPRFDLKLRDERIREFHGFVSNLSVTSQLVGPDRFSFALNYLFDREHGRFDEMDWDRFAVGELVDISMGYENPLPRVFVGRVASLEPDFPSGGAPTVTVSGFGLLHDLTKGQYDDTWNGMTDGQVVRDFFTNRQRASQSRHSFTDFRVADTEVTREAVHQTNESDFSFLSSLAERNGFELFGRLETVHFRKPNHGSEPVLTLAYGESLDSFRPRLDNPSRVGAVEVWHWDEAQKKAIVGREPEGGPIPGDGRGDEVERVVVPVDSRVDAQIRAKARLDAKTAGLVRGSATTIGIPEIRPGERIRLEGLGSKFTKVYYVTQVTHTIGSSGYRTSFEVMQTPNPETGG